MNRPDLTPESTTGDKYGYAMTITDPAEADAYFEACIQHSMSFGLSRAEAEIVERKNIGYWAGYYDLDARQRVERLFGAPHPILGPASKHLSAREIFNIGYERGKKEPRP